MAPLDRTVTHLHQIGGVATASATGRTTVLRGDDGTPPASVAQGSAADLTAAVAAARAAQPGWAGLEPAERGRLLFRAAELLGEPAVTAAASTSGTLHDDPAAVADRLAWWAGWADKLPVLLGSTAASGPYLALTGPRPLGVVGVLGAPDGDPTGLVESLGAALAAGNTLVVLAGERRPLPALRLAQTCTAAGIPGGVVNVIGAPATGLAAALADAGIDALDLPPGGGTGGAPDPAAVARRAGERLIPVLRGADPADPGAALADRTRTSTLWQPAG